MVMWQTALHRQYLMFGIIIHVIHNMLFSTLRHLTHQVKNRQSSKRHDITYLRGGGGLFTDLSLLKYGYCVGLVERYRWVFWVTNEVRMRFHNVLKFSKTGWLAFDFLASCKLLAESWSIFNSSRCFSSVEVTCNNPASALSIDFAL